MHLEAIVTSLFKLGFGGLAFVVLIPTGFGASFDCSKASTHVERAVCASPKLSALDEDVDALYRHEMNRTLDAGGARDEVRGRQRAWLRDARNTCPGEPCLEMAYMQRVAALKEAKALYDEAKANAEQEEKNPPPGPEGKDAVQAASATAPVATLSSSIVQVPTTGASPSGQEIATTAPSTSVAGTPQLASSSPTAKASGTSSSPPSRWKEMAEMLLAAAAVLQFPLTFWLIFNRTKKSKGKAVGLAYGAAGSVAALIVLVVAGMSFESDEVRADRAAARKVKDLAEIEVTKAKALADLEITKAEALNAQTPAQTAAAKAQNVPTATSRLVEQSARPTMKDLFDVGIPQARREDLARLFVAGAYHFVDRSLRDMPSVSNYTFSADGTLRSSSCVAFGEVAERKFEERSDRWTIKEGRYGNTGMIYYGITFDSVGFRPSLILDRDDGLLFNFDKKKVKMLPGTAGKCE